MKVHDFEPYLYKKLQDPGIAAAYLADAVECGDLEGFLLALRDVIEAHGGVGSFAKRCGRLHRVSLYKALSAKGNPLFVTVLQILDALGIALRPLARKRPAAKSRGRSRAPQSAARLQSKADCH